jgi:activator of 2-hydroxyglutaryl-CoA dehydratase
MKTSLQSIQTEKRTSAYEAFRSFSHDPNQKGETLNSVSPPVLSATKSLMSKRAFITRMAFKPEYKIAANSLLMPAELLWAAGFIPFNWEMFSSLIASHSRVIELTNKGSAPVPRCSFINSLKGAYLEGILPIPNVTVSSSAFCEGISHIISEIAGNFKVPHFHIDIPGYHDELSVKYLAAQLKDIFHGLCEVNGITIRQGEKQLRESFYYGVLAKKEYQKIFSIRKKYAPLGLGLEPLHWHGQFAPFWGDESGYRICKRLKDEILELTLSKKDTYANKEEIPVAMFGLIPYGRTDVWRQLKDAGVNLTFEGVNYFGDIVLPEVEQIEKMEMEDIYKNIGENLMHAPVRGLDFKKKSEIFIKNAVETGAKGIIIFSHEHCQMLAPRLNEYENNATKYGMKFVSISGDCILGMPKGPTGLRLGTFLNELKRPVRKHHLDVGHTANVDDNDVSEVRVGIDFGSGFSKYVAINRQGHILQKGLFTSGIDYPYLLNEIMTRLSGYKDITFALSGIGSDNQQLHNLVHNQTTEISSLIKAVKNLFHNLDSFLVIDIGTQDVKILKFYNTSETPWINTNKSCGAGTGMVLVQILERWKQSDPEIEFHHIDDMAYEAQNSEMINTTCGIFAVTNVVSALIQSEDERKKEILRGVYHYIASQAIKLMPPDKNTDTPLLLAGGVGNHRTLRQIFKEKGFQLLDLPEEIPYQHLIAYGTALSLKKEIEILSEVES